VIRVTLPQSEDGSAGLGLGHVMDKLVHVMDEYED